MPSGRWFERLLSLDRVLLLLVLGAVIVASWLYLLAGSGTGMNTWAMTSWSMAVGAPEALSRAIAVPVFWTPSYTLTMFGMWWIMMVAMMLPSATPVILLYAKISKGTLKTPGMIRNAVPVASFIAGYLLIWGGFSGLAVGLQWGFESLGLLSPSMMSTSSTVFAGAVLVYAGVYQISPLKRACLRHCQGPLAFISHHWRSGMGGALKMGLQHGIYCLGCCLGLMAILFFGGIMNLYWIGVLALIVLVEKILPFGSKVPYFTGLLLIAWGGTFFLRAIV